MIHYEPDTADTADTTIVIYVEGDPEPISTAPLRNYAGSDIWKLAYERLAARALAASEVDVDDLAKTLGLDPDRVRNALIAEYRKKL